MHALPDPPLQLITGAWRDLDDLRARVEAALRGGIRWLQLRAKERSAADTLEAALAIAPLLREAGALFVVNDRVDLAALAGAGVHLPENGLSAADARRLLGAEAWIAKSVHAVDAIRSVGDGELDAVQFGPVYETPSKRRFGVPRGQDELTRAAEAAHARKLPLIAVGGISDERAAECLRAGADAVAVIGAIWEAADIEATARDFLKR